MRKIRLRKNETQISAWSFKTAWVEKTNFCYSETSPKFGSRWSIGQWSWRAARNGTARRVLRSASPLIETNKSAERGVSLRWTLAWLNGQWVGKQPWCDLWPRAKIFLRKRLNENTFKRSHGDKVKIASLKRKKRKNIAEGWKTYIIKIKVWINCMDKTCNLTFLVYKVTETIIEYVHK